MITHLVFFKMLPEADGATGTENAAKLTGMLRALPGRIPELLELRAGTDVSGTPASWDVGLFTRFATEADLEAYRVHPAHMEVVNFVQRTTAERAVVDFSEG
jgi:hypothetical protein